MHFLLGFGLINLSHLSNHVFDPWLRHQFVEKCGHLVVLLPNFLCFVYYFFRRLFRKTTFHQFLGTYELVYVFVIVAIAVVYRIIEEARSTTAPSSCKTCAQCLGSRDHWLGKDFLSLLLDLVVLERAYVLLYV